MRLADKIKKKVELDIKTKELEAEQWWTDNKTDIFEWLLSGFNSDNRNSLKVNYSDQQPKWFNSMRYDELKQSKLIVNLLLEGIDVRFDVDNGVIFNLID